ncbi:MAG: hypothetical protein KZQ70_14350, partial [gamma proteobacterium symbiont of Lucinoma myriamae]|nr:hypothetical protein [gamma proteobacterium symbiont of Lucinoma myriamae]
FAPRFLNTEGITMIFAKTVENCLCWSMNKKIISDFDIMPLGAPLRQPVFLPFLEVFRFVTILKKLILQKFSRVDYLFLIYYMLENLKK